MRELYKIRIRLYNQTLSGQSPAGQFQGWFFVDAPMTEFGEPDFSYWLTSKEIGKAKSEMYDRFNRPHMWNEEEQTDVTSSSSTTGIAEADITIKENAKYGQKVIPTQLVGQITIRDLVLGLSTFAPVKEEEPQGATINRLMVIKNDEVNYDSGELGGTVYLPTEQDIERWRNE